MTACVSANEYVAAQTIGSVTEWSGFCRASPAWTARVEGPGRRGASDEFGMQGSPAGEHAAGSRRTCRRDKSGPALLAEPEPRQLASSRLADITRWLFSS
jgi:hypothetical protein